ncbi:heme ABC exporter ATP-binding protein CcmA [Sphingomicrobium sediminis]|uniref:Heme ABC exporter ATP-binding protein CcmA n=1 Tax=Sphingomicrobium sediminis TaxID=2950949 RepID=A0A9X2EIS0_9SPHN|nr:heme ABC exporter ATP-binding protein CcmA [Sphingomicrobium sediminis]MCM8558277.1 heme ABC exporter ATP-binding protein CcmA [Sphingomicrobium sediminis]
MSALLTFEGVTCARGGRTLFEDVSFALGPGDALRLTGPNGTGKSSLLLVASGLLEPISGRVEAVRLALADERIGLERDRSLRDALSFWAKLDNSDIVDTALKAMGLTELAEVPVRYLSTGQRRRAGLARAIASGARLLLLDEPADGLDTASRELLDAAIARNRQAGGAVLAASHQPLNGTWQELELGS